MALWKLAQGFAMAEVITIRDGQNAVITSYAGTEPLSGTIWAGDDRAPLVILTPTWLVAGAGTVTVAITGTQSATLTPGTYMLDVFTADKGAHFYRGQIEILAAAGASPPPWSYITYGQLLTFAAQAGRLLDSVTEEAQFAKERNQASIEVDRMILNRYQPQPGRSRRYTGADGTTSGPFLRFAPSPDGSPAPTRAAIQAYLGTSALLVNADLIECVAYQSLEILYVGQPGRDNPYAETGRSYRATALEAFRRALVEIDTNHDGIAELRIDQDVTYLT